MVSVGFWQHDFLSKTIWNYLVVNEKPQSSDVIIVLSGGTDRVEQGVTLYQQGYAPKLLLSGSSAHKMEQLALSLGVPKQNILLDVKSTTTFGNAYYSAKIMRAQGFQSAIVVTSDYHTHRASIIFSQFFKGWQLTVCATPYSSSISTDWWKYKQTSEYVITEYLKMVYLYLIELPGQTITSLLTRYNVYLRRTLY